MKNSKITEEGYVVTDDRGRSKRLKDLEEFKEYLKTADFPRDVVTMTRLVTLEATDNRKWWQKLLNTLSFGSHCKRDLPKDQRTAISNFKKEMNYE